MMKYDTLRRRSYWPIALLAAVCLIGAIVLAAPGNEQRHAAPPSLTVKSPGPGSACTGISLTPASKVQAVISHAPPGTTFCFAGGTYRVSSLVPKSGDVLDGGGQAAVLDGGNSASYAIDGDSASPPPSDVTVRGFVIRNFSTPLQRGAVQDYNGPGWIIQGNRITGNAAAGVATGDGVQVIGNQLDHNGQEGFSAHGNGGLYQGNEIAFNNL